MDKRTKYIQGLLHANGYPIKIDGIWGINTQYAVDDFHTKHHFGKQRKRVLLKKALDILKYTVPIREKEDIKASYTPSNEFSEFHSTLPSSLNYKTMRRYYGAPRDIHDNPAKYLTRIHPYYPLKYDGATVKSIRVNKKHVEKWEEVFIRIADYYSKREIEVLGLDIYGGTYNFRKVRGGSYWSTHAFGVAIDMYPARNLMKTPWEDALFSQPEYENFIKAWYESGFLNLGKETRYDAMHFQLARL